MLVISHISVTICVVRQHFRSSSNDLEMSGSNPSPSENWIVFDDASPTAPRLNCTAPVPHSDALSLLTAIKNSSQLSMSLTSTNPILNDKASESTGLFQGSLYSYQQVLLILSLPS